MEHNKIELLKAMNGILKQYQNNKHENNVISCPLCQIYFVKDFIGGNCNNCPMTVFSNHMGCLHRKCKPINQQHYITFQSESNRVIEFYKRAIKAIEKLNTDEFKETTFIFLKKIDEEVFHDEINK